MIAAMDDVFNVQDADEPRYMIVSPQVFRLMRGVLGLIVCGGFTARRGTRGRRLEFKRRKALKRG